MTASVLTSLRDSVPIRPLTRIEAMRIAELQAARFRETLDLTEDLLPECAISELPRIQVDRIRPLPVSGATEWSKGRWIILLNAAEPPTRQRFSLAHEFKHVLDNRFIHVLYEAMPESHRRDFIEQVCDYFAGCLLIPRPALKREWFRGIQQPRRLAEHFGVSEAAIQVRLNQTGLTASAERCRPNPRERFTTWRSPAGRYQRAAPVLVT